MIGILIGPRAIDRLDPPLNQDDFQLIKSWGFEVVSLYIPWHKIEPVQGEYSDSYISKLMSAASLAAAEGLKVVPVTYWHSGGPFGWPSLEKLFSGEIEPDFYILWQKIADLFQGYPVPWYHVVNEPRPWTKWGTWNAEIRRDYEVAWTRIARNVADIVAPTPTFVTKGPFAGAQWYCTEPSFWTPPPNSISYMGGYWPKEVTHERQAWTGDEQTLLDYWACALAAGVTAVHEIGLSSDGIVEPSRLTWLNQSLKLFNERNISWTVMNYTRFPDSVGTHWSMRRADGSFHPALQTVLNNIIPTPISAFNLGTALTLGGITWMTTGNPTQAAIAAIVGGLLKKKT